MAEETAAPVEDAPASELEQPAPAPIADPPLGDAGKKAIAEERKARKAAESEREALASRLKEFEDKDKSEAEKLAERVSKNEQRAVAAETELTRLRIAVRHGISESDYDLLGSGTEDQIEARAKRIAELASSANGGTPPSRRPVEQLHPGATPVVQPEQQDDAYPSNWLSPGQSARLDGGS